jgi:hypothetical protein
LISSKIARHGLGIGILGFEVRDDLRIVLVAQPLEWIDDPVTVMLTDGRDMLGEDRLGGSHAGTLSDDRLHLEHYRE